MTRVIVAVLVLWLSAVAWSAPDYQVWTESAMRKILRDEPVTPASTPVNLDALGNEHEAFQVIVTASGRALQAVSVAISDLRGPGGALLPASAWDLRLAHYIQLTAHTNAPGWYPDALLPLPSSFAVAQGHHQAVWLNCYIPAKAAPGRYRGEVTVTVDGQATRLPVRLRVRAAQLSDETHFQSAFAIWPNFLAEQYGLDPASAEFQKLHERVYWFLTEYRLPPDDLPVPFDSPEAARFLNDPRVNSYRIPYNPADPEGFKQRLARLREHGWLAKGYIYTIDEPGPDAIEMCREYGEQLNRLAPDARWLLTIGVHPRLEGFVDIWCPILAGYDRQAARRRQSLGENVWWYTCVYPQHPYPTYLINDVGHAPRLLSWLQAAWEVEGVLYWSVNIWGKWDGSKYITRDVWTDPLAFPMANGDGYLIYPGQTPADDPVPTLRLEMIRQGNEDFETLWALEQSWRDIAQRWDLSVEEYDPHVGIESLVNRIASSFVHWNHDPTALAKTRQEVLDEIEQNTLLPVLLKTSSPAGNITAGQRIRGRVWGPWGSRISVELADDRGVRQSVTPLNTRIMTSKYETRRFSFAPTGRWTRLTVRVAAAGHTRVLTRTFSLPQPLRAVKGEALCAWATPADLEKWTLSHVTGEVTTRAELGPCAKLVYAPGVEFPNVRLMSPQGLTTTNWTGKGYLVLTLYNPEPEPVSLTLKLFGSPGKAQDGLSITVAAHDTARCVWSVRDDLTLDSADIRGLELWMWTQARPRTLYLGPLVFAAQRPPA